MPVVVDVIMEWLRHNPRATVAVAAVGALVVIVLLWLLLAAGHGDAESTLGPAPLPTTPHTLTALPTPVGTETGAPAGGADSAVKAALRAKGGFLNLPGLQGGTLYKNLPRHQLLLTVTSDAPIGTVGYIVPTSLHENYGIDKHVGKSWSLTTTAYGNPDYAQVFVQAGPRGYPVTCRIVVDGRVTEERSTDGPYGQMMCQG